MHKTESGYIRQRCLDAMDAKAKERGMSLLGILREEGINQRIATTKMSLSAIQVLQVSQATGETLDWLIKGER